MIWHYGTIDDGTIDAETARLTAQWDGTQVGRAFFEGLGVVAGAGELGEEG